MLSAPSGDGGTNGCGSASGASFNSFIFIARPRSCLRIFMAWRMFRIFMRRCWHQVVRSAFSEAYSCIVVRRVIRSPSLRKSCLRISSTSSRTSSVWMCWKMSSPEVIHDIMSMTSSRQSNSGLAALRRTTPNVGDTGSLEILRPSSVIWPTLSIAPMRQSCTKACSKASTSGISIRGKAWMSSIP
ncbi:hypothetical protein CFIMG_007855RA00001 [Ceratocystis fimbriata CBS 114723]|uniref:Uncharacterized protein n=1 Tax=Ceratocystis fimbriata CBS 114723 TaxID=1035309 RepID=A0A2C5XBQ0_9PEZI|nr:hypothetical protein CFIMG_007855RA00001 [Ceratocystis fimbriata CBS 114723]